MLTGSSVSSTYTSAAVPGAPSLSGATTTTLNLTNAENGNPSSSPTTYFAVQVVTTSPNDATWLNQWVHGSGNPSATEVWLTDAQLDALVLQGLTASTTYGVKVKARNEDGDQTALSAEGQGTTLSVLSALYRSVGTTATALASGGGLPTVQATNTSVNDAGGTNHTVSLPSPIQSGDLLIVIFGYKNGTTQTITWPGGGV